MKSVIPGSPLQEDQLTYPCLKKLKGLTHKNHGSERPLAKGAIVVLFTAPKTGTVVWSSAKYYGLGHYNVVWAEDKFKLFKEQVVLQN